MSKHGGAGRVWHARLMADYNYECQAETHDPRCDGFATECHHIILRVHLTEPAMWLLGNGAPLSQYCHLLAHASHGASLSDRMLTTAVRVVNEVQGARPEFRIQPFFRKGLTDVLDRA